MKNRERLNVKWIRPISKASAEYEMTKQLFNHWSIRCNLLSNATGMEKTANEVRLRMEMFYKKADENRILAHKNWMDVLLNVKPQSWIVTGKGRIHTLTMSPPPQRNTEVHPKSEKGMK